MRPIHTAGVGLILAIAAGSASANSIYEGFSYTAGSQLQLQNGGTGWSNAWESSSDYSIQSGSLAYEDLATTGNSAVFSESDLAVSETQRSSLYSGFGASGTTTWLSFLLQPGSLVAQGLMEFGFDDMLIGLSVDGDGFYQVGAGSATPEDSTVPIVAGQTVFVAIEFEFNADPSLLDTANVYFDPTPGLAAPDVAGVPWNEDFSSGIDGVRFDGADGQGFSFDEIRVGDTYADVSPVTATPEPNLMWLAALGIVGMVALKTVKANRARGGGIQSEEAGTQLG